MAQKTDQEELTKLLPPKSYIIRASLWPSETTSLQSSPGSARGASPNLGTPRPEASDRTSAASQRSVTETDGPGTASALPQTDYDAKNEIWPFRIRNRKLRDSEKVWIKENIKTWEQNKTQKASPASGDQSTCSSQVRYYEQTPTKAFGALFLKEDKKKRENLSLFVHLADNTPGELIEELLVSKFEVTGSECHPIRIHCIDYDRWPSPPQSGTETPSNENASNENASDENAISTRLKDDLDSMCKKTAGIVLTWSGLVKDNPMHHALEGVMKESGGGGRCMQNLVCIATPPWNSVEEPARKMLQKLQRGNACLQRQPTEKGGCFLGPDISTFATHFLFLDDQTAKPDFSHFHCQMMDALERSEERKTMGMPVVCVLINGHHDALKMVQFALQRRIPVLIVKGSGGYADIIAEVYESATLETTKRTDEYGHVHTRITKKGTAAAESYMKNNDSKDPLLPYIFNNLDLLTIYDPAVSEPTLDSLVIKALLKNKQESKLHRFVKTMKRIKELCSTKEASIIDSDEEQMKYFIEAVRENCVKVVKTFLDELEISKKFKQHFHLGRVLKLYRQSAEPKPLEELRKRYAVLMKKQTVLPLRCWRSVCRICSVKVENKPDDPEGKELVHHWTCLHPFQELFLSSVLHCYTEMAVVFWQRCDDKIAAALVARKMFKSMAEESRDPDIKKQMEKNCRQFQSLAIQTLRNCQNVDETQTELLLTKPCPWWGNISVLQLALMTENREFVNETACRKIMDGIWKGKKYLAPMTENREFVNETACRKIMERIWRRKKYRADSQRYYQLLSDPSEASSSSKCGWFSPFGYFVTNFIMLVAFLVTFSFDLLFDFGKQLGNGMSYKSIILIIYVFDTTVEEIRQLLSKPWGLKKSNLKWSSIIKAKCRNYWSQPWNKLDVACIILFWSGMVVKFLPCSECGMAGRVLLAIDIFFFYMKIFHMFMAFKKLGLLLVMIVKMVKDTAYFMIILLVFVLAYAVTSESLLYSPSLFTWARLYHLPRKAYWQAFGELNLPEIEIRDTASCSVNASMHYGSDVPHCPTKFGSFVVPALLGGHVVITNVLLFTLLMARFGVIFTKWHLEETYEFQSWYRCQIIAEYCNRTSLPPPFNLLYILLVNVLPKREIRCCGHRRTRGCGCGNRAAGETPKPGKDKGQTGRSTTGIPKVQRSADKRSVDIIGINKMHASKSGNESPIKIEIMIKADEQTPSTPGDQQTPSTPGDQQTPSTPGDQQTPSTPGDQRTPSTPGDQQTPSTSGHQQTPSSSGHQQTPSTPGDQQTPSTPGDQRTPSTPGHQRTPSTPGDQRTPSTPETYTVAKKECRKQTFTIWDLDPKREYTVKVAGEIVTETKETKTSTENREKLQEIIDSEKEQAENVCRHQDSISLEDLQAQNDALKKEIERLGRELKESQAEASNRFHDRMCKMEKSVKTRIGKMTNKLNIGQGDVKMEESVKKGEGKMTNKSNRKQGAERGDSLDKVPANNEIYRKLAILHDQLTTSLREVDICIKQVMQESKG